MKRTRIASCHCRALRVTVRGEPKHVHLCSCTRCQQLTGSAFAWNSWFPAEGVTIEGDYAVYYFQGPEKPTMMKAFCPICGSGGFFRSGDYHADCIGISAGSFGDAKAPMPAHVHHWEERPKWVDELVKLKRA